MLSNIRKNATFFAAIVVVMVSSAVYVTAGFAEISDRRAGDPNAVFSTPKPEPTPCTPDDPKKPCPSPTPTPLGTPVPEPNPTKTP